MAFLSDCSMHRKYHASWLTATAELIAGIPVHKVSLFCPGLIPENK